MTSNAVLTAKVLEVFVTESNIGGDPDLDKSYTFKAYEFSNGLILVPGETTNDWFFEDGDSIQANGNGIAQAVEETGDTQEWTALELLRSVQGSMHEFGIDSVPAKHLELWK